MEIGNIYLKDPVTFLSNFYLKCAIVYVCFDRSVYFPNQRERTIILGQSFEEYDDSNSTSLVYSRYCMSTEHAILILMKHSTFVQRIHT